ncbi:arylsulfatase [Vibrio gazogenes]|uniref:Arylsulfatase n=1 Tax=Vibrio gazogenes DSM 21264 = NBRC 103151 TaxID=1123492 RepID=A0A1M5FLF9_VIBGA|nr:arylsulfatase [Vibrio gazogenes]USP14481.1 arylsulfatase [Vibrio gazogenes]SHF92259.1 arylsulfatase [Vibrio gazogenes DSM 21264] [Vibrio gazogenes DSM 21264 = NBRC 103151]SJN57619.1 Arylsulfatase [Vibrio gazogenes]
MKTNQLREMISHHFGKTKNSSADKHPLCAGINAVAKKQLFNVFSVVALASTMTIPNMVEAAQAQAKEQHQPNVIVILLDDVGFSDIGAYGSEIKTPNIDALAEAGIRYNRFDTNAMSGPTRASLLTGRNAQTVHMEDLPPKHIPGLMPAPGPAKDVPLGSGPANSGELPLNAQTVADAFRSDGYATYALGKWHLAPEYAEGNKWRDREFWPLKKGFDYYYGFISGHADQWHPKLMENNDKIPTPQMPGYHLSVDLTDHAIHLMDEHNPKPKFLYFALGAAHAPLHVPKSYINAYKGQYDLGWDKLREQRFKRQKELGIIPANTVLPKREKGDLAWASLTAQQKRVYARFMETYAGFLTHTDEQIGRLIQHLKDTGQYDNTMIVFASDNGAASEGTQKGGFYQPYMDKTTVEQMDADLDKAGGPETYMLYQRPWAWAGATPFRRYKLWPFAGGVRTPLIISWPGHVTDPGSIRHQYVNLIDLGPTMLEAAGTQFADKVDGVKQIPVAGKSMLSTLTDKSAKTRNVQFFEMRGQRAITQGKWKAIAMHKLGTEFADDQWALFDTEADFSESNNLASKYPKKVAELKKLWWSEANKYSDPAVIRPFKLLYQFNHMDDAFGD